MADDNGSSYLKQLAKNRLKTNGTYSKQMRKKTPGNHRAMKNGSLNTSPMPPKKNAINRGNPQTFRKTPPGNMNGPKNFHRVSNTKPVNGNKLRGVS